MFNMLNRQEILTYIEYLTNIEKIQPGMKYVFMHYADLENDNCAFIPQTPLQVSIRITDHCNLNCLHCSRKANDLNQVTMKNWKGVIDALKQSHVLQIILTGGEPTIHPEFSEIVSYIKKNGFMLTILSNGLQYSKKLIEHLNETLNPHTDRLSISLDGIGETYDKIRCGSHFDELDEFLKKASTLNLILQANMVISDYNYTDMFPVYKYCAELKIPYLRYLPLFEHKKTELSTSGYYATIKEFCRILNYHNKTTSSLKIISDPVRNIYPFSSNIIKYYPDLKSIFPTGKGVCPATITSCEISPDGFIYPCSYFDSPQFYAGNIYDKPLNEIWKYGLNWKYIREKHYVQKACERCLEYKNCQSGCPAVNFFGVNECVFLKQNCIS